MKIDDLPKLAVEKTACPRCKAGPGKTCVTATGNRVHGAPHNERTAWLVKAWCSGFDDGAHTVASVLVNWGKIKPGDLPRWLQKYVGEGSR